MKIRKLEIVGLLFLMFLSSLSAQGIKFMRDFSPAEGIVKPQEKPFRDEICLNGKWDFQPVAVLKDWKPNTGVAPDLSMPISDKWEKTQIKIPSPWNVNEWGGGSKVGAGTDKPYSPSSLYFPSYPLSWGSVRMGWLKRSFSVPENWQKKKIMLHFEAIMGEAVIFVNGKKIDTHFGDYLPFEIDLTDYVNFNQSNELLVGVKHRKLFDKTDSQYKYFRSTYPPGSNTDNLVGIWQDVFLVAVPPVRISNIFVKPWVDKDELEVEVTIVNQTKSKQKISIDGDIKDWINKAGTDDLDALEIKWELGTNNLVTFNKMSAEFMPGETRKITLKTKISGRLKYWTPSAPNLYTILLNLKGNNRQLDCKTERFGWRQLTIKGRNFYLNGERIQCFADIQHPFGAYICSRRFAWAWYKMIKDFGGNSVRLHAQPWPKEYLDLADEMGLMVLDEGALFGSSLSLNLEEDVTWQRTQKHIDELIMRDRNHPSVIGWSLGNELFAISLYNKPSKEVEAKWDEKIVKLTERPALLDPTRPFITDDGDKDMDGHLPVWSKHFGHGLKLDQLPNDINKPLVIGEFGATYYGKPKDLYEFAGEKAYESYYGRNEALAVDLYQNVTKMALPYLAYFSPSEVSWFGIEHLNLGYNDYSRLPNKNDGIFAGLPYQESKPGYQMERIPPYVTTFNPGLDPNLPIYKPLPMFIALKSALTKIDTSDCQWSKYTPFRNPQRDQFPEPKISVVNFIGDINSTLAKYLKNIGVELTQEASKSDFMIIDGENVTDADMRNATNEINRIKKNSGNVWIIVADTKLSPALDSFFPAAIKLTGRKSTALQNGNDGLFSKYFGMPDLYFSETDGEKEIMKQGITGDMVIKGNVIFEATNVDWSLFNGVGENKKCAQVVLYEHLQKPDGAAMISFPIEKGILYVSTLNYKIQNPAIITFWGKLFCAMGIQIKKVTNNDVNTKKSHDLLLDGPVNE